jgi:hypothetical protein
MKKSSLTAAIFLAALTITTHTAHAETATQLRATINSYGLTAGGIGNTVTVTGTKTGATTTLTLDVDVGVTVDWTTAQLDGNIPYENDDPPVLVLKIGAGSFNMSGGKIEASSGIAINNNGIGVVTISGGTVSAPDSWGAAVYNLGGKIIVSGTAEVTSGSGNEFFQLATICNYSSGTNGISTIEITGGTVKNTASNTYARAVYNASTGVVNISGGTVLAKQGYAVYENGTGTTTLTGGLVFAYGTAANNVIYGNYTNTSGNAVVLAWNNVQTTNTAFASTAIYKSAGTAHWLNKSGKAGIDYANGANTGFIELAGVTVSKATPAPTFPTANGITYNPSTTLSTVTLSGGTGAGTFAWQNGTTVPTVANSGYPVVFTPTDAENYNTATQSVSLSVAKTTPAYTIPTGLTATYGQTLANVSLASFSGWSWMNASTLVDNAGARTHSAKFTPSDAANYNVMENINVSITVAKAKIAKPTATTPSHTYSGTEQSAGIAANDAYTVTGDKQTNAGSHTATVALKDKTNYEWTDGTTTDLSLPWSIAKATPDMLGVSFPDQAVTHNGNSHSIYISGTLPPEVSVSYTGNGQTELGDHTVTATFSVDEANYNVPAQMTATLTINNKITPDMSGIAFADKTVTYSGQPQSLAISGALPSGVTVSYKGNGQTNAGEYEVTAVFAVANTATHNTPAEKTATLTIAKANPATPAGLTATAGQTLAAIVLPAGWAWATPTASVGEAGTRTHKANFTPSDANYNAATDIDVSVAVTAETPIRVPQIASGNIRVQSTANAIVLENLPKNAKVEVYSLQGKRIYSSIPGNPQILRILVQTKGLYVVKIGSERIKVAVR